MKKKTNKSGKKHVNAEKQNIQHGVEQRRSLSKKVDRSPQKTLDRTVDNRRNSKVSQKQQNLTEKSLNKPPKQKNKNSSTREIYSEVNDISTSLNTNTAQAPKSEHFQKKQKKAEISDFSANPKTNITPNKDVSAVGAKSYTKQRIKSAQLKQEIGKLSASKMTRYAPEKLKNLRLAKKPVALSGNKFKISRINGRTVKGSPKIDKLDKLSIAETVGGLVTAPAIAVKNRAIRKDENGDTGIESAKLGLRGADKIAGGVHKTVKNIKHTKNTVTKIHKRIKRSQQVAKRTVKTGKSVAKITGRTTKSAVKSARIAARTAKFTAKAAAKAAKIIAKAAVKVVKAVAQAVQKIVSLIVETAPWSLIVIAAIIILILLFMLISSAISSINGSVQGVGTWAFQDDTATPEEAYEELEKYIDKSKDVMKDDVQDKLKDEVDEFCQGDTAAKLKNRRIIEYSDVKQSVLYFPAKGNEITIDSYIDKFDDDFDTEFYSKFLAALFVLMTRDKQNADGVSDDEIYDFSFKKSDFKELINTVNQNFCQYGDTYVYKTTEVLTGQACPGEDCDIKYCTDVNSCPNPTVNTTPVTDENGDPVLDDNGEPKTTESKSCPGHPFCPHLHTKLIVKLYTIEQLKQLDIADIYNFTENEKARYEGAQKFIQGLIDSYGNNGGTP